MKTLRYQTAYLKSFLMELTKYAVTIDRQKDCIVITAQNTETIHDVIDVFKVVSPPLTYQIEGKGLRLTIFNPTV